MPLDREKMRNYQAERRAAIKAGAEKDPPKEGPKLRRTVSSKGVVVMIENGKAGVREFKGPSGYYYLLGDEVIGNMTQQQRDFILRKLPQMKRA